MKAVDALDILGCVEDKSLPIMWEGYLPNIGISAIKIDVYDKKVKFISTVKESLFMSVFDLEEELMCAGYDFKLYDDDSETFISYINIKDCGVYLET